VRALRENMKFRGVYFAGAMARVQAGYAITSIANTQCGGRKRRTGVGGGGNRIRDRRALAGDVSDRHLNRAEVVMTRLRLGHLNKEEMKQVEKTCPAYQDIFHLQGEMLTSITAVRP
jgi:hypothetical protein